MEGKRPGNFINRGRGRDEDAMQAVGELCLQTIPVQAAGDREMTHHNLHSAEGTTQEVVFSSLATLTTPTGEIRKYSEGFQLQ